jgi:hypothetical protein
MRNGSKYAREIKLKLTTEKAACKQTRLLGPVNWTEI